MNNFIINENQLLHLININKNLQSSQEWFNRLCQSENSDKKEYDIFRAFLNRQECSILLNVLINEIIEQNEQ